MQVWNPIDNPKFETLSYLPPLTDNQIAREIDYMLRNKWIPCLEFDPSGTITTLPGQPGYYGGRYWTMWKLPMFGCNNAGYVLREIEHCKNAYPGCFIRVLGFDNIRQVQCCAFIVHKPQHHHHHH
uniref:Ribulose bisphosphate carboxylase small subunit, chloroplastic n=1 Tax=Anthoceros agrestis TaxID=41834 RepID=A0ABF7PQA5_9EMBR